MRAADGFGHVESCCAVRNIVRRQRITRRLRDWFLRERMRQRFERSVIFEREMRALVGLDQHNDRRRIVSYEVGRDEFVRDIPRRSFVECEPMRIREASGMSLPRAESRQVIEFSGHLNQV